MAEKKADDEFTAKGMPFEIRCKMALDSLNFFWQTLDAIAKLDMNFNQDLREVFEKILDTIPPDPATQKIQLYFAERWDAGIKICKRIWGDDATDIAIASFRKNLFSN